MATSTSEKRPTLRTIAKETGFSVATVSRALANDPQIAHKTRHAIAEMADRLNYIPDRAAQRLRTGQTKVIGLLLNTEHEFLGFTDEILSGITDSLANTQYAISIIPEPANRDRLDVVRKIVRHGMADGLVLSRTEPFDDRVRLLHEAGLPFVTHGRTEFTTPHAWVDFDNEAFARHAVERLVAKGCERLMLVLPHPRFTFAQHIKYGFLSAVRNAGISYEFLDGVDLDSTPHQIAQAIHARYQSPTPPDGHICVGEVVALATLSALSDLGVAVGQDVHVLAKQASPVFQHIRPKIETVAEDLHATGQHLGELLIRQIQGESPDHLTRMITPDVTATIS